MATNLNLEVVRLTDISNVICHGLKTNHFNFERKQFEDTYGQRTLKDKSQIQT
jgi:hypothetical protein